MRTSLTGGKFRYPTRAWILACVVALAVLVTEFAGEYFLHEFDHRELEIDVFRDLSTVRTKLESIVNSNLLALTALTAVIAANPQIDQAQFARIAQGLVDKRHALRNIAAAPDMVVSLMYPLEGNRAVLGLDYRAHPSQGEAAMKAVASGQLVVAGPLDLVQGGLGIIARAPVYIDSEESAGPKKVWGLISSVLDAETLFEHAGLYDPDSHIRVAIRGLNGTGRRGAVFFGEADLFNRSPVTLDVTLPGGSWHLAAVPLKGWDVAHPLIWTVRLTFLLVALLAGSAVYLRHMNQFERARAERDLSDSEARLRTLVETIPDLVWLKDPDGVYLSCNPKIARLFGAPADEIIGKTDSDFFDHEQAAFFRGKDQAAMTAGKSTVNEEWVTYADDGHRELLETIKTPMRDAAGKLIGVLGIARDITERERFEAALRDSEERLRLALQAANQGLYDLNVQTGEAIVNDEYARMLGYDPTQFHVTYDKWIERLHPDDRGHVNNTYCRYVAGDLLEYRVEFRHRMKSGDWLWVLSLGSIVEWTKKGDPVRMLGTHTNINDRKESEAALRRSEALFRTLASLSPVGVFRNDQQGNAVYVNARCAELVGLSEQACLGDGWVSRIHAADRDKVWRKWQAIVARGERFSLEYRFEHEDGGVVWVFGEAAAVQDDRGNPSGFIGALTDVTQLKKAETLVRHANEELERRVLERTAELRAANAELEAFTYAVSHDLRAPLRAIQGFQHALEEDFGDQLPDGAVDFLREIHIGGKRMGELIDGLLELSRSTRGEVSRESLDLGVLALEFHQRMHLMSPDRTVTLNVHGDLSVEVDLRLVKTLLQNLIENAWKYTKNKESAMISLYSLEEDDEKVFCIEDDGAGFDQAFASKLFEPFQRLHHQDEFPGVGIGLATVQRIIRRHGGWIEGKGEIGKGASFRFTLDPHPRKGS